MFFHPSVLVMYLWPLCLCGILPPSPDKAGALCIEEEGLGSFCWGHWFFLTAPARVKGRQPVFRQLKGRVEHNAAEAGPVRWMCVCLNECLHACMYASYNSVRPSSNWMSNPEISHVFILFWYIYSLHMHAKLIFFIFMQPFYLAASCMGGQMLQK